MSPLEASLLVIGLALPFHFLLQWQLGRLSDPQYLRTCGVVVCKPDIVQFGQVMGSFSGMPIHDGLVFMGMHYRFDRIVPHAARERIGAGELYLEPGLVYVAD